MRVQHNIPSMNAYRNFNNNSKSINKNLEKLSSGYKINRAGDDAAGLAISEKMRAQITGLDVAQKNAKDGISLVQTAEGALTEVHDMLNRMYKLAEQSANGTYDGDNGVDRTQLQKEVDSLVREIDRISQSANFNGIKLLNGDLEGGGAVTLETDPELISIGNGTDIFDGVTSLEVTQEENLDDNAQAALTLLTKQTLQIGAQGDGTSAMNLDESATGFVQEGQATFAQTLTEGNVTITMGWGDDDTAPIDFSTPSTLNIYSGQGDDRVKIASIKVTWNDEMGEAALDGTEGHIANSETVGTQVKLSSSGGGSGSGGGLNLQIGDTADDFNKMAVSIGSLRADKLGSFKHKEADSSKYDLNGTAMQQDDSEDAIVFGTVDEETGELTEVTIKIDTETDAANAMQAIKDSINYVSDIRGGLGALQNRLEHTINNLSVMQENIQDAESTIRDTDVAEEMMKYTKNNILVQSAQAMLAQANQLPQGVLQLLQ